MRKYRDIFFLFWCHLDGLELGDLGPQLEVEDGEDEEGETEAQHQALHVLHPPVTLHLLTSHLTLKQTDISQNILIFTQQSVIKA